MFLFVMIPFPTIKLIAYSQKHRCWGIGFKEIGQSFQFDIIQTIDHVSQPIGMVDFTQPVGVSVRNAGTDYRDCTPPTHHQNQSGVADGSGDYQVLLRVIALRYQKLVREQAPKLLP